MKNFVWFILVLTLIFAARSINAQSSNDREIKFTVPIRLLSLHQNISKVKVSCSVTDGNMMEVGKAETEIDVPSSGDLIQTIYLFAHSVPQRDIMTGVQYECRYELGSNTLNGYATPVVQLSDAPINPLEIKAQPGQPFLNVFGGTLLGH
ncbi:hypothetical protein JW935_19170 [candidate division KSB1 bacterium]|nr:hypothetical protein [candidate division KSB1 bacterium]